MSGIYLFTALQMQLGPAVAALHAQAFPARQRTAEAPSRFCGGFSMPQRSADHRGPCCGSVEGSLHQTDEPAQAKPFESPPGYEGSFAGDQPRRGAAASRAEGDGRVPCHCPHVDKLMADVDVLKIRSNRMEGRINSLDGQRHGGNTQCLGPDLLQKLIFICAHLSPSSIPLSSSLQIHPLVPPKESA